MVLIFISWIYIVFTTITVGFCTDRVLQLKNKNFIIYAVLGLFSTTILSSIWAIFDRINIEFHLFYFIVNVLLFLYLKNEIEIVYLHFFKELASLKTSLKIILSTITILILAQCASMPYIIDNESYYIQTIKWINEYGFVKGLANLHFFLAQTSGWHILQSAFNFSFLYDKFNDLSGFCLLLGNVFSVLKLNDYFKNKNLTFLIIGLLPLANAFFFQFISSPSPDIPIYIFSLIIFFYFIQNYRNLDIANFNLIVILVLFLLYIKTTAFALVLIPMFLLVKNFRKLSPDFFKTTLISTIILILFMIKNTIISGYPFFPVINFNFIKTDFFIPETIAKLYYQETKLYGYLLTKNQYDNMSALELLKKWISLPNLHGLINKWSLILIISSPIFIYKYFHKKEIWILYFIMCLQMVLLFFSSPQYRFFLNFILMFTFFLISLMLNKNNCSIILLYFSTFITGFVLLIPINLNIFTKNKFTLTTSNFSIKNTIIPYKNTKFNSGFEYLQNGNLYFYSPIENDFFWGSGDGKLPCVNKAQIEYFNYYYKVKPQKRSTNLKDGFYSKDTKNNKK